LKAKKFLNIIYIFSAICLCLIAFVIFDSKNTVLNSGTNTNLNADNAPYEYWEGENQNANPDIQNEDGQETQNDDKNQTPITLPNNDGEGLENQEVTGVIGTEKDDAKLIINPNGSGEYQNGIGSQNAGNTQASTASKSPPTASKNAEYTGMVNLNSASFEQLCSLDGIGEVLAQRIIDYRKSHGGFKKIEEIMDVSGIAEKKFAGIKDRITV